MNVDKLCNQLAQVPRDVRAADVIRRALRMVDRDGPNFPRAFASALRVCQDAQADRDDLIWFWNRSVKP